MLSSISKLFCRRSRQNVFIISGHSGHLDDNHFNVGIEVIVIQMTAMPRNDKNFKA